MKSKTIIAIIVAVAVVVTGGIVIKLIVDNAGNSPKGVIERFETAYNEVDVNGMVECFDPQAQSMFKTIDSIASSVLGVGIEDLVNDISFLAPMLEEYGVDEGFTSLPKLSIKADDVIKEGDEAIVTCTVTISGDMIGEKSEQGQIKCVKVDGYWYISSEEILGSLGGW